MADLVLGLGTSHSPQLHVPGNKWFLLREKDETDARLNYTELLRQARPEIAKEIADDVVEKRVEACMSALATLKSALRKSSPDVLVMVGDDQHENFHEDNMPAFCIYRGDSAQIIKRSNPKAPRWKTFEEENKREGTYPCEPALAEHVVRYFTAGGFDVACSNRLKPEVGLGHAFTFIYRYLMPEGDIPVLPIMVNAFYPPNRPTPLRCYQFGQRLRLAIEDWRTQNKVALVVSGGLSHVIVNEDLDRRIIDALQNKKNEYLCGLSDEDIFPAGSPGTSEIANWVLAAGALEELDMNLAEYLPVYRSPAGTGCGMAFAKWQ